MTPSNYSTPDHIRANDAGVLHIPGARVDAEAIEAAERWADECMRRSGVRPEIRLEGPTKDAQFRAYDYLKSYLLRNEAEKVAMDETAEEQPCDSDKP
jgi:hypothetical protein